MDRVKSCCPGSEDASGPFINLVRRPAAIPNDKVADLSKLPRLTSVQFGAARGVAEPVSPSDWPATSIEGIVIRTACHGQQTLFHVRTYSRSVPETGSARGPRCAKHQTINQDGSWRTDIFSANERAEWQDATHFEGEVVPLSVIGDMQRFDRKMATWSGRNYQVSFEAWQVLLKWQKGSKDKGELS